MNPKFSLKNIHKVVAIGDSITQGVGASSQEKCWVSRLEKMLNEFSDHTICVLNRGIGSNILSIDSPAYPHASKPVGLERLQKDVMDENPDLVIIAYGFNDARGGISTRDFRRDYQLMIDRIRSVGSPMIVCLNLYYMCEDFYKNCIPEWNYSDDSITEEFNLVLRQLCEKNGLVYADVYSSQCFRDWFVCGDHCHPSDLGYFIIANKVFEAIARNCVM